MCLFQILSDFHLLVEHQFGFLSTLSTHLALTHLINTLTSSFNDKLSAVGVFIDLFNSF